MEDLHLAGARFRPLPCGALWWPERRLLVVADLHLEKGSSLARAGWLVPPYDSADSLHRLEAAQRATGAEVIVALGDSFHDRDGPGRLPVTARDSIDRLLRRARILWVVGNHDGESAARLGGSAVDELALDGIIFRHEACAAERGPEVSGHYHPAVHLALAPGRRAFRRCFALAGQRLVLPAYGSYAGGLDVRSPDLVAALGEAPVAILPTARGLLRVPPERTLA